MFILNPNRLVVGAADNSIPCTAVEPKLFTSGSKLVYCGKLGARCHRFLPVKLSVTPLKKDIFLNTVFGTSYANVTSLRWKDVASYTAHSVDELIPNEPEGPPAEKYRSFVVITV